MTAAPARRVPARVLAAQIIGRALDNGVRPDVPTIVEQTALTAREVQELVEQVRAERARTTRRLKPTPDASPEKKVTAAELIAGNLQHPDVQVQRAARRAKNAQTDLEVAVDELRKALQRVEIQAMKAERIADLSAQIAALQGKVACSKCGQMIVANRMGKHATRMHKARP